MIDSCFENIRQAGHAAQTLTILDISARGGLQANRKPPRRHLANVD